MEMLESISIIGGADGPTSIFLAGVLKTQVLVGAILGCFIASLLYLF